MLEFRSNVLHDQPQTVTSRSANSNQAPLYPADRDPGGEELSLSRVNALRHTVERLASCTIGDPGGFLTNFDPAQCNNCSTDQTPVVKSLAVPGRTRSLLGSLSDPKETGDGVMTIDIAKPQTCKDFWSASSKRNYQADDRKWTEDGQRKRLCANNGQVGIAERPAAEYFSGDSDLTAERMAEGGSQTSSLDDGCTLTLDGTTESVSKQSSECERRSGLGIRFPVARVASVDGDVGSKQELVTAGYIGDEQSSFLTRALGNAYGGYQGEMNTTVADSQRIANTTATTGGLVRGVETKQLQTVENEDDWLQLGLGRTVSKHYKLANQSAPEVKSSRMQPEKLSMLDFIPPLPDESSTLRGTTTSSILYEENEKPKVLERGKLLPCVAPVTATVRLDTGYCDLPIQISACVPLLSGTQPPFPWQDEIERYAGPIHRDHEGEKKIFSTMLPGYSHAPSYFFAQTSTDGKSKRATWCQDPILPEAAGSSRLENWQQRPSGKALPTWASFHDALASKIPRNTAGSALCALDSGMPVQHHISAAAAQDTKGFQEWPRIVDRFTTNLSFQNPDTKFTLLDSGRSIDIGLMPNCEITTQLQHVIDRCRFSESQDADDRNMVGFRPSWLSESLMGSDYTELSGPRMLSSNVRERSHYERQLHSANVGSNLIQQRFPQSLNRKKGITKPGRGPQGFWFALQAKETQNYGRLLPQIPRSYIRIKDGSTPISAVKKYLAAKLGLSNESEVEITCRGKELLEDTSLEDVRAEIWCQLGSNEGEALSFSWAGGLPSSSEEFVMILTYGSSQATL